MSVVTGAARRRWAVVAAGVAVLVAAPAVSTAVADRAAGDATGAAPRELVARAVASGGVGFSGLAESRGTLGLPDLPQLESVGEQFGGTTRTRVWWRGPHDSRVDVLTPTGEQGVYTLLGDTVLWDYERNQLTEVFGDPPLRLPRADDLVPPQAARRLLAGVGPADAVTRLPAARVAGVRAAGVRVVPGDPNSTIARLDVWLDPATALPLRLDVVDDAGVTALSTTFTDLHLGRPEASAANPPSAPGARYTTTDAPDLVSRIRALRGAGLPGTLAGLPSGEFVVDGPATYGSGLTRFAVLPLPGRLVSRALDALTSAGAADTSPAAGEIRQLTAGALTLVAVRTDDTHRGWLVAGPVTPDLLARAARELLLLPPPGTGW